ncbi:hypothetical protein MKX03_003002 [Papaver bracteatum]|nr:hypothetical protein MKX03_003002 [Papaver bracteatum]
MIIHSPEPEVKILVDRDPVKTSFEEWDRPCHFSRAIAKGPDTTTWIWNLHADANDLDSHTISWHVFPCCPFSNYEAWLSDPTHIRPSAQVVWPIVGREILNGDVGGGFRGIQIISGFFQIWRVSGITSELQLYCTAIGALIFAALMLFAGWFHYHKAAPKLAWFQDVESMLNHHLAELIGLGSLSWAGHQIHVYLPINQFLDAGVDLKEIPLPHEFILNRDLLAQLYPRLDPVTGGLWMTDIAHHYLAIAILFLIAGHMYRTNWGIGHGLKDILEAHTGQVHKGLYEILTTSWHAQLSLNLSMLVLSLFTHHMWIGGFFIVGASAHATIFMVRDYYLTTRYNDLLDSDLRHRDAIISQLNWACIFLGFHSFCLYIHNDTMSALGRSTWCNNKHQLNLGGSGLLAVGGKVALLPIPLGTADFLVHHIHAFTIHVTVLILLKGVLFDRSSCLIPDKANLGFRFPYDGPGSGGTCQVSVWDHVFLGLFWMYNAISVSDVCGSINDQGVVTHIMGGNFAQSFITINEWLRDFLWAQASQVIYLMFLFSGRGYWKELIESIVWAHNKLKFAPATQPRALSIVQGRVVGVTHYLLGGIATTWAFFLAIIIVVG